MNRPVIESCRADYPYLITRAYEGDETSIRMLLGIIEKQERLGTPLAPELNQFWLDFKRRAAATGDLASVLPIKRSKNRPRSGLKDRKVALRLIALQKEGKPLVDNSKGYGALSIVAKELNMSIDAVRGAYKRHKKKKVVL